MLKTINEYRNTLEEYGKFWLDHVIDYMEKHHQKLDLVFYYQRPTYKLPQDVFLMLGGGMNHFSIYTNDFSYVEKIKNEKHKYIKCSKSAILFPHDKKEYLELAYRVCDEVIDRTLNTGKNR